MASVERSKRSEERGRVCPGCGKVHKHLSLEERVALARALGAVIDAALKDIKVTLPPGIPGGPKEPVGVIAAIHYLRQLEESLQAEAERLETLFRTMEEERPAGFMPDGAPVRRGGTIPQEEKEPIGFKV